MKHTSCITVAYVTKHSFMDLVTKLLLFWELLAAWQHFHKTFMGQPEAAHSPQPWVRILPRAAGNGEPSWHQSCITDTKFLKNHMVWLHQEWSWWGMNSLTGERMRTYRGGKCSWHDTGREEACSGSLAVQHSSAQVPAQILVSS